MENKYKGILIADKAHPLMQAAAFNKMAEIDEICASETRNLLGLFQYTAAASVVYQNEVVFKSVMDVAEKKLCADDLNVFSTKVVHGCINQKRADCLDISLSFMESRKMQMPLLEGSLADTFGKNDQKDIAAVLIKHGADLQKAMDTHETEIMARIRQHGEEILTLRRDLDVQKMSYGITPRAQPEGKGGFKP